MKNVAGRLVPKLFLFFKKVLYEVNASSLQLSSNIFREHSTCHTLKTNYVKCRVLIQRYTQFWFLRKGNSFSTFCDWFFKKIFLMVCSISWSNFIVCLPLLLEILGNIYILIICFLGCDVMNFEINPIFLIKLLFYMTKKSRQQPKYLENEKSFKGEIKIIFHHFWRAFSCQKLSQIWECTFKLNLLY